MDVSAQSVLMLLAMMLGIVALAGLIQLARWGRRCAAARRARALGAIDPEAWAEEPPAASDRTEQLCLERWQALLGGRGPRAQWTGAETIAPAPVGSSLARPRRRRILIGTLMVAALPAAYLSWTLLKQPPRGRDDPADIIELAAIDKWADAVSMFEDKLRVRFTYRNRGARRVDAFNAYLRIEEPSGGVVLQDVISVNNPVAPGQAATWTQTYWETCKQVRSPEDWAGLLQRDLGSYRVEWHPLGLVYDDGEGRISMAGPPLDSLREIGR